MFATRRWTTSTCSLFSTLRDHAFFRCYDPNSGLGTFAFCLQEGWGGKKKKDRKTGEIKTFGGLKNFFANPWTVVDSFNYALFIWYIVVRIDILSAIYDKNKIIVVPTNKYESVLEEISSKLSVQLFLNFANILLCLVRCFKFYRFQPRLAIINKTLVNAFPDLYHFILMFITVLFGFAVMSTILFGTELWQFATLFESLNTGWMWMNGAVRYADIARVDAEMATVYYVSFVFLINIVLLNGEPPPHLSPARCKARRMPPARPRMHATSSPFP